MPIRYVIRPPSIGKTPRAIANALGVETRRSDATRTVESFDWERDLFLGYPEPGRVRTLPSSTYGDVHSFIRSSKAQQRRLVAALGVCTPATATSHDELRPGAALGFIVRRNHHSGGRHYRLTQDPNDFIEGEEYIQEVYPKDREYRIIFVFGEPLITLHKVKPEGVDQAAAWNHATGASFQTINNERNNRLAGTDVYSRLASLPIIIHGHIIAADVMWSDSLGYSVCELNSCPGITIPANLERIVSHVQGHH
jgi:hypothetical protein